MKRKVVGWILQFSPIIVLVGIMFCIIAQRTYWWVPLVSLLFAIVSVALIWIGVELTEDIGDGS